jgi:hypothetical protein
MSMTSYAQVRERVRLLIEGDEIGVTFSTSTLDLLISMGENRVYRNLKSSTMYTVSSALNATSNVLAIPAAVLQLDKVIIDGKAVEVTDLWRVQAHIDNNDTSNDTIYCAQRGDNLIFWPEISDTTNVYLYYYATPTALATTVNSTYERYPELFLYAAVSESAPFIGEDNRIPIWEGKYNLSLNDANRLERWKAFGGSAIRIRSR